MSRRNWSLRCQDLHEVETLLHVAVRAADGQIGIRIGDSTIVLDPRDAARLRAVLLDAIACGLTDRGHW